MKRDRRSNVRVLWLLAGLVALPVGAGERRALLVGIDDYSAEGLKPAAGQETAAGRSEWPDLYGAVNDATAMREMLIARYGFEVKNVLLLIDQEATRASILAAIDRHLILPAGTGDHAVFFFAGHGSQVVNSKSDEPDGMDETRIPADSRLGARDVRDKELRGKFNRILDRGARLTVIFDSCHSGSGSKEMPRARRLKPDRRDVADGQDYGQAPENRGALVLAASQDFELAWETLDAEGQDRGAFSLALLRAMRAAGPQESAEHVFQRAEAGIRIEEAPQYPVLAGTAEARSAPLFGGRADSRGGKTVVAVRHVAGGTVSIQGGWANGLTVGSELRPFGDPTGGQGPRLRIIAIEGLSSSVAEIIGAGGALAAPALEPGDLLELSGWASPSGQALRVWIPEAGEAALSLARQLEQRARRAGIDWIADPVSESPTHVLRWHRGSWCLQGPGKDCEDLGAAPDAAAVIGRLGRSGPGVRLFVRLPAPPGLVRGLRIGPGTDNDAVETTADPRRADYFLIGRLDGGRRAYAWVRSPAGRTHAARSPLPLRSDWHPVPDPVPAPAPGTVRPPVAVELENAALLLAKLRAWLDLESPAGDYPYRLAFIAEDGRHRAGGTLRQGERYGLVLRAGGAVPECCVVPRYTYVFVLDSFGNSTLLFPFSGQGSVENRFPLDGAVGSPPAEIALGPSPLFEVGPPYGKDTYFLLTTEDPIPNPWVLEYPGVRTRGPNGSTALEELLSLTGATSRGEPPVTPVTWSIERLSFDSVAGATR